MAVIGKIRNQMGVLLVAFVGVALLAFVLGDLLSNMGYFLQGDRSTVGKINGNSVKYDEFQRRLSQKEKFFSETNPGAALDEETRNAISDETWNEFIEKYILNDAYADLGVKVGDVELADMMGGRFVHPFIQRQFTNENGTFEPSAVQNFLNYISDESSVPDGQIEDWRIRRAQWANIETAIEKNRLESKYQTLLEKGIYTTSQEVARQYAESGDRFNIRYVGKNFAEVADSTVQVSDSDLKKAYEENKNRFKSNYATRGLRFAIFDIRPTGQDSTNLYTKIAALKADFESSTDDTSFVYSNSDLQQEPRYFKKDALSKELDSALYNSAKGFVYGPYVDGSSYYLAKKISEKTSADSVKVSVILIGKNSQQGPREDAKESADSIYNAIKAGANFKILAATLSEDPTTAKDSGSIGWIPYEFEGNPIIDSAYNARIGEVKLVETPDLFAIVRSEEKTAPVRKALIGFVSVDIKPSEETVSDIYSRASDFSLTNKSVADFEKVAKSGSVLVREDGFVRENAKGISGLPESRSLVKWAFEKKVGDVSSIEQFGNRYVVAIVTKAWSAGVPKFDELKEEIRPYAIREKKAEQFISELKAAAAAGNIDQVASSIKKQAIPATDLTFQSYGVPGVGYEPALVGAAAGATQGKLSGPFKGVAGVYVLVVDAATKGANPPASPQQKTEMSRANGQRVYSDATQALLDANKVVDWRFRFY